MKKANKQETKPVEEMTDDELCDAINVLRGYRLIEKTPSEWYLATPEGDVFIGRGLQKDAQQDVYRIIPYWPGDAGAAVIHLLVEMPDFSLKWWDYFKQWYVTDRTGWEFMADTAARAISEAWYTWKTNHDTQSN